ncbi:MAG: gamma-glutamyl-gamma-aminobutyrate hydrolase family protein [Alphaproteobacteria bacterium]
MDARPAAAPGAAQPAAVAGDSPPAMKRATPPVASARDPARDPARPDHDRRPLIAISANTMSDNGYHRYSTSEGCVLAVRDGAGGVPLIFPGLGGRDADALLDSLDGLLLSGGRANVQTHLYDGPPDGPNRLIDPRRDSTVLPLIRHAVRRGIPVFGLCRGMQEINVALGGSLFVEVSAQPGKLNHRMTPGDPPEKVTAPRHWIDVRPGGIFDSLFDDKRLLVNSLHGQAVNRMGRNVRLEAVCEDGVIEAISVDGAPGFVLGVQWHPEYKPVEDAISRTLFAAFGAACRAHMEKRLAQDAAVAA